MGEQFGARFGDSVLAVDLNGDGLVAIGIVYYIVYCVVNCVVCIILCSVVCNVLLV